MVFFDDIVVEKVVKELPSSVLSTLRTSFRIEIVDFLDFLCYKSRFYPPESRVNYLPTRERSIHL